MKKSKPIIALMLCVTFMMSGCGANTVTEQPPTEPEKKTEAEPTQEPEKPGIEENIPALKEAIASAEGLGEDAICGACVGTNTADDEFFMELIEKHFNAVTLENELKPDAMFGSNNNKVPEGSIHEEDLNGKTIKVPTLDHTRADALLDKILDWNDKNPNDRIRVRGHVLVWHSQTPDWFFKIDYDNSKDYVSKEEMDERQEWYIKSMLEYYTGEDSKYRDLFYGWDVVNEAVSDRTGSYRTDTDQQSSSWWKVYGSSEYIVSAFRYANAYAPKELDLYYNDYNECDKKKKSGILALIEEVKVADGTRIDGFGMQGHHQVYAPTAEVIEEAVRDYAAAVDKVMITELDTKPSMMFNGTDEAVPEEYERQAKYLRQVYDVLKKLHNEGVAFEGITFWGVTDQYSWLQQQGQKKVYPLLFDAQYKAKPAFYSFFDDLMITDAKKVSIYLDSKWEWAALSEIDSGCAFLYEASSDRKDMVIAVNAGHGTNGGDEVSVYCHPDKSPKITNGANPAGSLKAIAISKGMIFYDGAYEADVALRAARMLRNKLLEKGYDVLMVRDAKDVQLDNVARTVIANNMADCLVSLHWDGDELGYDKGCFFVPIPDEIKEMEPVASHWEDHEKLGEMLIEGLRNRNCKIYSDYIHPMELTQTCYSTIPSVVIELGNGASVHDDATLENLAEGLLDGIENFMGNN